MNTSINAIKMNLSFGDMAIRLVTNLTLVKRPLIFVSQKFLLKETKTGIVRNNYL